MLTYFGIDYKEQDKTLENKLNIIREQQQSTLDSMQLLKYQIRNDIQVYGQQSKELGHKKVYGK